MGKAPLLVKRSRKVLQVGTGTAPPLTAFATTRAAPPLTAVAARAIRLSRMPLLAWLRRIGPSGSATQGPRTHGSHLSSRLGNGRSPCLATAARVGMRPRTISSAYSV